MWKQSKQEDPSQRSQNTSKKSKVMNCTKGREKERAVGHEAQRGFIYSFGTMAQSLIYISSGKLQFYNWILSIPPTTMDQSFIPPKNSRTPYKHINKPYLGIYSPTKHHWESIIPSYSESPLHDTNKEKAKPCAISVRFLKQNLNYPS